ncbi:hypothetical protein [Streptomyces sp. NPDC097619]|uniref:hypothetical protein n=1 Tax=Streptomyces sp. NPDC097619 TaxID=3157228 RepID=UPI0033216FD8
MWEGCHPVLGAEPEASWREITGWEVPGVGEIDVDGQGHGLSVLPSDGRLRVELAFPGAYAESDTSPYRKLGPVRLVLEGVRSLRSETPGAPEGPLWKRVLNGHSRDELPRMAWDAGSDVLEVRDGGTVLRCEGGSWRWEFASVPVG